MRPSPVTLAVLALGALAGRAPAQDERPNILFLFTDDHASHAISAYGSKINHTPQLDRIANEGMLFENAFCTNSICAPSRAVILSGKHSHQNGVIRNGIPFDGSQVTLPKLLGAAGYETAMIGKWHLQSDPTGFDYWEVLIGQGPYYNPPLKSAGGTRTVEGYTTDIITDLGLDWLKERDDDEPFFLMLQHKAPHRSWDPAPRHLTLFDDVTIPEPATLFDDYEGRTSAAKVQEMTLRDHFFDFDAKLVAPRNLTEEQLAAWNAAYGPKNEAFLAANLSGDDLVRWRYQRYIKDYLRCVHAVDEGIGRVLDYLDESGLAENTIVVYSSDQGFYLGDHGWYDKRWMYEESLRMPLLVRWPGVAAPGTRSTALVQNLDFAPTMLAAAGVDAPAEMQGESFVEVLRGATPADWRDAIYYHYYEFPGVHAVARHFGVRTDRYKLIRYYQIDEWELFDLHEDPDELRSVHDDPRYTEIRAGLERRLVELQEQYGDTNPTASFAEMERDRMEEKAARVATEEVAHFPRRVEDPGMKPDPGAKPLYVAARVQIGEGDPSGVAVAQGGASLGYALFLRDGRPGFGVRAHGEWFEVLGPRALTAGPVYHVAGSVDARGTLHVRVNGVVVAAARGSLVPALPGDGLSLGRDSGSNVGPWEDDQPFPGELADLRIWWGMPAAELRKAWVEG